MWLQLPTPVDSAMCTSQAALNGGGVGGISGGIEVLPGVVERAVC